VDFNSEIAIQDAFGIIALKAVKEELEKQKQNAGRAAGIPNGREPSGDGISGPLNILKQSIKHVPANKYAFGVVGIVAAASVSIILVGGKWQAAIAGGVVMLAGMVVLRVFSGSGGGDSRQPDPSPAAQALTWLCIVAFAVVLGLFVSKLYVALFPTHGSNQSDIPPLKLSVIPPDRLLSSSPFRARLDDCTLASCDVEFVLRGYDPKGRLRYDAREGFKKWVTGQFRDTVFDTVDKLYFQQDEKVAFQLYCRLGTGPWLVGDEVSLDWRESNEKSEGQAYFTWPSCGSSDFKASVGIDVHVATQRMHEPAVKQDPGPPGQAPVPVSPNPKSGSPREESPPCVSGVWVETRSGGAGEEHHDWTFKVEANGHLETERKDHYVKGEYKFQSRHAGATVWMGNLTFQEKDKNKKRLRNKVLRLVDQAKCDTIETDNPNIRFNKKTE
jgi:hypothetical protein